MTLLFFKTAISGIAVAITLLAFIPYIRAILRGSVRPHVFSWVIWGTTTFLVFLAQLQAEGGIGAWPIGISGIITIYIAALAYHYKADITISRSDWLFFMLALSSVPLWLATADPLWAVVILTTIDLLGFGPTLRKVYHAPYSESLLFINLFALRNLLVIAALESYSIATLLFPAVIGGACLCVGGVMIIRRRQVAAA